MSDGAAAPTTSYGSVRAPRRDGDPGAPTTLLVARHGRTPNTEAGRFAGRDGEDPALSATGEQDAARLGAVVAAFGGPGSVLPDVPRPTAVVASPMRRTRQTAQVAAAALGLRADEVTLDDGWVEASFGSWENLTYGEIVDRFPQDLAAWQGSMTVAPHGGDALTDVMARVRGARQRLVAGHPGECVLVVTHATCVRAVVHEALGCGDEGMWRTRVTPAALTVVRYWRDGGVEVAAVNATAHLAGA
ncbi:histidine phosphatase family protein [Kineosporia sp. A_224]|uniref:histidine phosphatase family protein n=1 Tax=Kineosporia sp. A_224 TaxID=1962180 RepID=UPI001303F77E|nr:histidine phosphatase family protein [Kineosporia sp. A_224]